MPRVQPKKRFRDDQLLRAWQSFSVDINGVAYNIRRNTRLKGSHEVVQACPFNFISADASDDDVPNEYPEVVVAGPRFTRPTKLKLLCRVLHGSAAYDPGAVATFPAETASWLVDERYAEPA